MPRCLSVNILITVLCAMPMASSAQPITLHGLQVGVTVRQLDSFVKANGWVYVTAFDSTGQTVKHPHTIAKNYSAVVVDPATRLLGCVYAHKMPVPDSCVSHGLITVRLFRDHVWSMYVSGPRLPEMAFQYMLRWAAVAESVVSQQYGEPTHSMRSTAETTLDSVMHAKGFWSANYAEWTRSTNDGDTRVAYIDMLYFYNPNKLCREGNASLTITSQRVQTEVNAAMKNGWRSPTITEPEWEAPLNEMLGR